MANVINFFSQCSDSAYNLSSSKSSPPLLYLVMYINILLYWVFCSDHTWLDIRARKASFKKLIGHPKGIWTLGGNFEGTEISIATSPLHLRKIDTQFESFKELAFSYINFKTSINRMACESNFCVMSGKQIYGYKRVQGISSMNFFP